MNAYDLEKLGFYKEFFDIDSLSNLGCVMLDLEWERNIDSYIPEIPEELGYHSPNLKWVNGVQKDLHVTLLYGLLVNANTIKNEVRDLMIDVPLIDSLKLKSIDVFPSTGDEEYSCIVGVVQDPRLKMLHGALSAIPHISTFPEYKPHITLAYVPNKYRDLVVGYLDVACSETYLNFKVTGVNYGYPPEENSYL